LHVSEVQALLSLQTIGVFTHAPVAVLHVSVVQALLSLQFLAAPGTQTPPAQVSFSVQALPSEHDAVLLACAHRPVAVLHESVVQTLLSSQFTGVYTHPIVVSHVSTVQGLLSVQKMAA
jgi:hypothetical protein